MADSVPPWTTTVDGEDDDPAGSLDRERASGVLPLGTRYADRGLLGRGGMGEVRRVHDRDLDRCVALKVLSWDAAETSSEERFGLEASLTAGLQHPGIVPVYDRGLLPDGRPWYTMREVHGRTLAEVIAEVHGGEGWVSPGGWSLRRLVEALTRACEAVGYAHHEGVIHRDLKPQNIMVGEHGEVLVLDWGIARRADGPTAPLPPMPVRSASALTTRVGQVLGTPAYMPPEQALGDPARVGRRSDVYALGATLYQILTGRPPFVGLADDVLATVISESPQSPTRWAAPSRRLPDELVELCLRTLARDPAERPVDASAVAAELRDWLDGARRREHAELLVEEARVLLPKAHLLQARADDLHAKAQAVLAALPPTAPVEQRYEAWAHQDEADALELEAALIEIRWEQKLRAALTQSPDLPAARSALADHHRELLVDAERNRDPRAAARNEALLRIHDDGRHAAFLTGDGALTLVTDPPGAIVRVYRYRQQHRRLVPSYERSLGPTPLFEVRLSKGSYLLEIISPGCAPVHYPVQIERGAHWDGVAPGEHAPTPIILPQRGALEPDEAYIPAGWFLSGGPDAADGLPLRRIWTPPFITGVHPITVAEFIEFLDDLVATGHEARALELAPRAPMGSGGTRPPDGDRDHAGRFLPGFDDAGHPVHPRWPVTRVNWHGAMAFAAWRSARRRHQYRLPDELEWEKAARGVDGRRYPFGDHIEAPWVCALESHEREPSLAVVDDHPVDVSPYGVRGMAGNARDWCIGRWTLEGPPTRDGQLIIAPAADDDPDFRAVRGGAWASHLRLCHVATRLADRPNQRFWMIGFRLVRGLDAADQGVGMYEKPSA
ncbi:MAG: SUMF1/EgtB/PvdO family nonheme iron enzyme [Myxococcales bacterium]|nr:SUMF1/EgtB/PvdO family nonheme iron enzyme [Myxococcales bacterium]